MRENVTLSIRAAYIISLFMDGIVALQVQAHDDVQPCITFCNSVADLNLPYHSIAGGVDRRFDARDHHDPLVLVVARVMRKNKCLRWYSIGG